jgi:LysM repeat protein
MTLRRPTAWLAVIVVMTACAPTASPTPSAPASASEVPSPSALPSAPGSAGEGLSTVPSASNGGSGTTYTVRGGDTLSSIARAWGTTVAQLQAWNGASYPSLVIDPNTLEVGWILVVAGDPGTTPLPTAVPTAVPTPVASGCRAGNRVAAGAQQTFTTVPNAGHGVALTLDMGGRLDPGIEILNLLIAN